MVVDGTEGFAGCVHHGSRCVVHRADKHAQVGSSHVIAWEVVERATVHYRFPFGILQSLYTFKVQDVGIGALYTVWLESMQVQYQAVLGGAGYKAVSYTHLRAHETGRNLVCRLLLEKKKRKFCCWFSELTHINVLHHNNFQLISYTCFQSSAGL